MVSKNVNNPELCVIIEAAAIWAYHAEILGLGTCPHTIHHRHLEALVLLTTKLVPGVIPTPFDFASEQAVFSGGEDMAPKKNEEANAYPRDVGLGFWK